MEPSDNWRPAKVDDGGGVEWEEVVTGTFDLKSCCVTVPPLPSKSRIDP